MIGMLAVCLAVYAVQAQAAGFKKTAITHGVSLMKKTFDTAGNAVWKNKGAIAVGTAAAAVALHPDILAQPMTAATTAVATEASRAVRCSPVGMMGTVLFFAVVFVIVSGAICVVRHYLKLWHLVPLLLVSVLVCSGGIAEAGTFQVAALQSAAVVNPIVNIVGWVIIIALTVFIG